MTKEDSNQKKAKEKVYVYKIPYGNSYELLRYFMGIYCTAKRLHLGKSYLQDRPLDILTYYMLKGYSEETKQYIRDNEPGMNHANLNQVNSELTRNKFLVKGKYRSHQRTLSKELIELKELIMSEGGERKIFAVLLESNG